MEEFALNKVYKIYEIFERKVFDLGKRLKRDLIVLFRTWRVFWRKSIPLFPAFINYINLDEMKTNLKLNKFCLRGMKRFGVSPTIALSCI